MKKKATSLILLITMIGIMIGTVNVKAVISTDPENPSVISTPLIQNDQFGTFQNHAYYKVDLSTDGVVAFSYNSSRYIDSIEISNYDTFASPMYADSTTTTRNHLLLWYHNSAFPKYINLTLFGTIPSPVPFQLEVTNPEVITLSNWQYDCAKKTANRCYYLEGGVYDPDNFIANFVQVHLDLGHTYNFEYSFTDNREIGGIEYHGWSYIFDVDYNINAMRFVNQQNDNSLKDACISVGGHVGIMDFSPPSSGDYVFITIPYYGITVDVPDVFKVVDQTNDYDAWKVDYPDLCPPDIPGFSMWLMLAMISASVLFVYKKIHKNN